MTEKSANPVEIKTKETDKNPEKELTGHHPRKRRKMLATMVAGTGTVIVGKLSSGEWKRPIIDAVVVPAHAQTSGVRSNSCEATITCAVAGTVAETDETGSGTDPNEDGADQSHTAPGGGWQPNGVIGLGGFDSDTDAISLDGVTASLVGASDTNAISVVVSGSAQDDIDDGQGQSFDIESGGSTDIDLDASGNGGIFGDGNQVDLFLTFSNPCAEDCVIRFQFNGSDPV